MEARLSASRIMVVMSRMVGKELNSSGFRMNTAVIRIRIEKDSEKASAESSSQVGSGTISTTRIAMMPMARPRSRLADDSPATWRARNRYPLRGGAAVVTSVMLDFVP